jgi:hypothetical protein
VTLTVTRDFGTRPVGSVTEQRARGSETVMQLLERSFRVRTGSGQGVVRSIDGSSAGANRARWFFYVNGIEPTATAARTKVHSGDRIWFDLHDATATASIPAVVGSFPEPFVHGRGGKRLPTVLECAPDASAACERVAAALRAAGIPAASQTPGTGSGTDSLTVLVGTWTDLRKTLAAELIQQGPAASGVYAKFASAGDALELLDPRGQVVRTLGRGAGLLAASAKNGAGPTWFVTGTDVTGVSAAAAALAAPRLGDRFALVVDGSADLPLPQDGAS